ncbi:MAG: hypothetical protein OEZ22_08140 [Spirochaetia bacterium]|nr:hypothetical protein [Spirochaetia bacterium]
MKNAITIVQVLLGAMMFVFGINYYLKLLPSPPASIQAKALLTAMSMSGYLMDFIKITETVCGALLLTRKFVPLALIILAPVVLNILMIHLFLNPSGIPMGLIITGMEGFLLWVYRDYYKGILSINAKV